MIQNFQFEDTTIDNLKKISKEEKQFRLNNLKIFNNLGFPNNKFEDWKFTNIDKIIKSNFKKLRLDKKIGKFEKLNLIKNFEHNYIIVIDGKLNSINLDFEDEKFVKVNKFKKSNFNFEKNNSLINLNNALYHDGFFIDVKDNYKMKKSLVVYNIYTQELRDNMINIKNKIMIGQNSEIHLIEYNINNSKYKFFSNICEKIILKKDAKFKHICIQENQSDGFFHKYSHNKLSSGSDYSTYLFPSGLKFNKVDLEFNLEGENINCNLQSASFLKKDEHQEIKTRFNHLFPNCKSFQKVKNVLGLNSKGIFQGKIYVKDIAQKTNAYQLGKAIILNDNSEFNSKPELEIYADDVKCTHGSTSGSLDKDAIYYLMTRGLNRKESTSLLIDAFLNEIIETIRSDSVKGFIKSKFEKQIYEY